METATSLGLMQSAKHLQSRGVNLLTNKPKFLCFNKVLWKQLSCILNVTTDHRLVFRI